MKSRGICIIVTYCWKLWHLFCWWVFLQATKKRRRWLADQNKQQISCQNFKIFLMELHWSATFFKEMVKTKSDLLKNLDNFYKNRFHIETFMSYMNMYHCSTFKPQYSEPWYSEFHDIVNKTQLPFWGFTRHITFDIVNLSI